ncbi:C39 family peptidase [Rubellicoccus peritrichatus]|uniref:C39 family peptidase n=1 Tax=Rubellicoccus peritrichatus TaxID=3080537 RepID=A0AAQ3L5M8_9BACT|nr:C39 family peptidase [Puniceicoccus sp. CR14]WOO39321.1 C39 family peptidase [Puniceicoccus sp. CR14]
MNLYQGKVTNMPRLAPLFLLLLLPFILNGRTFTDKSGREIEAEIVNYDGGDTVSIRRADGIVFDLPLERLSEKDQEFIRNYKAEATTASPEEMKKINSVLGIELFADGNLWDDSANAVAERLGWPRESQTGSQESFRIYHNPKDKILGARPHSSVLYGRDGKVDYISIIFANKGDSAGSEFDSSPSERAKAVSKAIEADGKTVARQLAQLGEPEQSTTATGRDMKERLKRWRWNGHSILLAEQEDEYIAVRIMPDKLADQRGRPERTGSSALKTTSKANVEKRSNGDVIVTEIPMVDQGPKGYCVPATLERVLRYMDIRADMYLLAMAGQTDIGGGTRVENLLQGAERYVKSAGREFERERFKVSPRSVAKYIDEGRPIIWTMYSGNDYNAIANSITKTRRNYDDADAWKGKLKEITSNMDEITPDRMAAHACLIIGYNPVTKEIAVSDSWGPSYRERWIPSDVAEAVSQGSFYLVDF